MNIKRDENWKQPDGTYKCPYCDKCYVAAGITSHIFRTHTEKGKEHKPTSIFIKKVGSVFLGVKD